MNDYRHYYNGDIFKLNIDRIYPLNDSHDGCYYKPNGFWFSIGDSWEKWCIKEDYNISNIKKYLKVIIRNLDTILFLNEDNIKPFLKQYSYAKYFDKLWKRESFKIFWNEVKNAYNGIIIDNEDSWLYSYGYGRTNLMPVNFLEAWDCLSGVVWNLKGAGLEIDPMPSLLEQLTNEDQ